MDAARAERARQAARVVAEMTSGDFAAPYATTAQLARAMGVTPARALRVARAAVALGLLTERRVVRYDTPKGNNALFGGAARMVRRLAAFRVASVGA